MTSTHNGEKEAPTAKLLVSEAEAARMLSVSRRTLFTLRAARKLRYVPIGPNGIRYAVHDLLAFIESQAVGGT